MFFSRKVLLSVSSYFPLAEASHDMELAYESVCVHTLLNVNNQDLNKTSVSRLSED